MNLHRLQLHLCKVRSFKLDEVGIWCVSGIDGFKFKYMNRLLMLSNMHVEKHAKKWHEKVNTSYAYKNTHIL